MIGEFEQCDYPDEWHSSYSITLGELIEEGFEPFGDERWSCLQWYSDDVRTRLEEKITAHYYYRDIGLTPPGEWRHEFTRVMGEILPKYLGVYQALKNGYTTMGISDEYGTERHVWSDFPSTQLNTEVEDYARNAQDREYEYVKNGDLIEQMERLRRYNDVDAQIIEELEVCFSCLISQNLNGF